MVPNFGPANLKRSDGVDKDWVIGTAIQIMNFWRLRRCYSPSEDLTYEYYQSGGEPIFTNFYVGDNRKWYLKSEELDGIGRDEFQTENHNG